MERNPNPDPANFSSEIESMEGRNPVSVSLVNGISYGIGGLAATAGISGIRKLLNKANASTIRWFPKAGLWASAGLAAIVGIIGFVGTRRENAQIQAEAEKLISNPSFSNEVGQSINAWKAAGDPAAKQSIVDSMLTHTEHTATTKHRDAVNASRTDMPIGLGA